MLALKPFRSKVEGATDLLNPAALIDSGIVQGKDGSLNFGWYIRGPDIASSTDNERNDLTAQVNAGLARLGGGWSHWTEAIRVPSSSYPPADASHFPDRVSRMVDAERRVGFEGEGVHFESIYAFVVSYMPPARRKTRVADIIYDDDAVDRVPPAKRILDQFKRNVRQIEDRIGIAVKMDRMRSYVMTDRFGTEHLCDELVNFLYFCFTGEQAELALGPSGAYLDTIIGGRQLWPGDTPRLGNQFIMTVRIDGFPSHSYPGILDMLDHLAIPYRWSTRFIHLDQHEALAALSRYRLKWKQKVRGFAAQLFKTQGGTINEDALLMTQEADASMTEANSGLVGFGYYTAVIVLMGEDRVALEENANLVARELRRERFSSEVETINTMEAWLGTQPSNVLPNVRRPPMHTEHLSHLMPLASVWTGEETAPCPFYPPNSPPLFYAATDGSTPMRVNLHVGDLGHTLIFGPPGAGKTVLLCTVAFQALRYPNASIWSFDYKRGMMATVKACRGDHYDIGGANSPLFCPFGQLDAADDYVWACDYAAILFQLQQGHEPSPQQRGAMNRALQLLQADKAPGARSMTAFVDSVQDESVREVLRYYTLVGAMGRTLDAEEDGIEFGQFMTFEMEQLLTLSNKVSIPVLLYLFRRFEKSLTGRPTFLLLDEAGVLLGNPMFKDRIPTWLRILRSKNCVVILATQRLSDAVKSGILDALLESCPTKIFLPNPDAEVSGSEKDPGPLQFYQGMGLNEKQISIIRHAFKKRDYYLVQPDGRRLFQLNLGPVALAFASATSETDIATIKRLETTHGEEWPFAWLDTKGVQYAHLT